MQPGRSTSELLYLRACKLTVGQLVDLVHLFSPRDGIPRVEMSVCELIHGDEAPSGGHPMSVRELVISSPGQFHMGILEALAHMMKINKLSIAVST